MCVLWLKIYHSWVYLQTRAKTLFRLVLTEIYMKMQFKYIHWTHTVWEHGLPAKNAIKRESCRLEKSRKANLSLLGLLGGKVSGPQEKINFSWSNSQHFNQGLWRSTKEYGLAFVENVGWPLFLYKFELCKRTHIGNMQWGSIRIWLKGPV